MMRRNTSATVTPEGFDLDALAARVAPLVVELLARRLVVAPVPEYYDNATPPPGWSRRRWRDHAGEIRGAYRDGRSWRISRADYEAHTRSGMTTVAPVVAVNDAKAWTPDAALASVGLRATRPNASASRSHINASARLVDVSARAHARTSKGAPP